MVEEKIQKRIYEISQRILDLKDRANSTIVAGEINKLNKCIKSLSKEKDKLFRKLENEQNRTNEQ